MSTEKTQWSDDKVKQPAKKKGFWGKFGAFLMMGGWILILIVGFGIYIAISIALG